MYYLFLIYSPQGAKHYLGTAQDPWQRVQELNADETMKYTGKFNDWEIRTLFEISEDAAEAERIDMFLRKQKTPKLIEKLAQRDFVPTKELAILKRVSIMKGE